MNRIDDNYTTMNDMMPSHRFNIVNMYYEYSSAITK